MPESRSRPRALFLGVVLGAVAFWLSGYLTFPTEDAYPGRMALAVTVLTATCWLSQCLPLAPASLIPLALMPLLGVAPMSQVAPAYADPILWLFFGGFVLALAIQRWNLHRRIALTVIAKVGLRPRRLVLGFMLAGLALSMWISNTGTSLMLLPIGIALIDRLDKGGMLDREALPGFGVALMLGIAYGCSVGGTATPIGTGPNLLFLSRYERLEQVGAPPITFLDWMVLFVPFAILLGLLIWAILVFVLYRLPKGSARAGEVIHEELRKMGRMSSAERRVLVLFGIAVLLWVTRRGGWADLLGLEVLQQTGAGTTMTIQFTADGTVALLVAICAFLVPSGGRGSPTLMNWQTARQLPWEILILLGGGIAIADAFKETGLSVALAGLLRPAVDALSPILAIALIVLLVTFLTEVTSNTATTALMLPLLASMAHGTGQDPRMFMLPAAIAASCAFMLPIATPPNAVVFSSGRVTMGQMARCGVLLNFVSVAVITLWAWIWLFPLLGVDPGATPAWWK
ncbi:MAG: SLC13 family permease [Planctomycetota bacterium]|jgi:sodium-dependent dicarboxylate transporter 2/3/5